MALDKDRGQRVSAGGFQEEKNAFSAATVNRVKRTTLHRVGDMQSPREGHTRKQQPGHPNGPSKTIDSRLSDDRPTGALFLKIAEEEVSIFDRDEVHGITAIEAVMRAQFTAATEKGNVYAQKQILERYDREKAIRNREIAEECARWNDYVTVNRKRIADAEANNEPVPLVLPHPDDVRIDAKRTVHFKGPCDEAELRSFEETCCLRDTLLMQDALDRRCTAPEVLDDENQKPSVALLLAVLLDDALPKRMRLGDTVMTARLMGHEGTAKRILLKNLHRAWKGLGIPLLRGTLLPPLHVAIDFLCQRFDLLAAILSGRIDPETMPEAELVESLKVMRLDLSGKSGGTFC